MDKVIQKLISIEEQAQGIVKDAREMKSELNDTIQYSIEEIRSRMDDKIEKKKEMIRSIEKKAADERLADIQKQLENAKTVMTEKHRVNKDIWVEKIFNEIING